MHVKAYKNELIVGLAFLFLIIAFSYKHIQVSNQNSATSGASVALGELKDVIALKKVWGDKKNTKKVEKLQTLVSPSKVQWHKEGKKLTASFQGLSAQVFNRLIVKIMNLPVEIQKLEVRNTGSEYQVEFKCKW
ncbi:MAG: hypothetical protein DSZ06_01955 [Sulfurospirillum sp.]|nr:MAG: hypothetical protein DSZ06_01955 [Sulfurospirillum sp.]